MINLNCWIIEPWALGSQLDFVFTPGDPEANANIKDDNSKDDDQNQIGIGQFDPRIDDVTEEDDETNAAGDKGDVHEELHKLTWIVQIFGFSG